MECEIIARADGCISVILPEWAEAVPQFRRSGIIIEVRAARRGDEKMYTVYACAGECVSITVGVLGTEKEAEVAPNADVKRMGLSQLGEGRMF